MLPIDEPVNRALRRFLQELEAIEPGIYGTPCSVELINGGSFGLCLARINPRFSDKGDWINPAEVARIIPCPHRMPLKFAKLIKGAGESGMGYHTYMVQLSDGASFVQIAENFGIDFLDLPPGYSQSDVTNVLPYEGRERSKAEESRRIPKFKTIDYAR